MSYNKPIKNDVKYIEFVKAHASALTVPQMLVKANELGLAKYNIEKVRRLIKSLGLEFKKPRPPLYTQEELAFLRDNQHLNRKDLLVQFNEKFNRNTTAAALNVLCTKRGFRAVHPARYKKGFNGWRDGVMIKETKGAAANLEIGMDTRFKKGQAMYFNRAEVGYERKDKRGFTEIRVEDGTSPRKYGGMNNFELKHHYLWRKHFGEIPPNHCVIFKDGDIENFDLDNLMLMPRGAINVRNSLKYAEQPDEIKPIVNAMAQLIHKTNELEGKNEKAAM